MIIIPAVDIKNGKCVRLLQGRMEDETVYSPNPAAMARKWAEAGAELIHVIDLDGAFSKHPQNIDSIREILKQVDVPIQVGGGIRSQETIRRFIGMGVKRVIIGTEAIQNPRLLKEACAEFPNRIVLGIDARDGEVAIDGWTHTTRIRAIDLAKQFESCELAAINFTDISRDGMQTGPNLIEIQRLAEAVTIPVVAAGGVSTIKDIRNLLALKSVGVAGVIVGKALYTGSLNLKEAIKEIKA
jgi:phosphoribosylformimino-5-aminoimidazole carboxamide ribotide isomerase